MIHRKHSNWCLCSPLRCVVSFSCKSCSDLDRQCSDHGQTLYNLQSSIEEKGIVLIPNNFCIEFKPDGFGFQTLLTNLRDISTRADVLRFSKSQVLFQPGKHREYRLLTKHMQPHVMIKTCWESHRGGVTNLAFTLPVLGHPKVRHICIRYMIKLRKRFFFTHKLFTVFLIFQRRLIVNCKLLMPPSFIYLPVTKMDQKKRNIVYNFI